MSQWVTDTHALLWYLFDFERLSALVKEIFTKADAGEYRIIIPAIVLVEIVYLSEKGKIAQNAVSNILSLLQTHPDNYRVVPLDIGVVMALRQVARHEVPDMPDRIIAATALALNLPLLSRDSKIRALSLIQTVW